MYMPKLPQPKVKEEDDAIPSSGNTDSSYDNGAPSEGDSEEMDEGADDNAQEEMAPDESVKIPEAFQKAVAALIKQYGTKECLDYMEDLARELHFKVEEEERQTKSAGTKGKDAPQSFDMSEAPSDID